MIYQYGVININACHCVYLGGKTWHLNRCVTGVVGEMENNDGVAVSDSYYIWAHKKFDIGYNGKQIVDVNLTSDNRVKLVQGARIPFSYEVNWKKSNIKFEDRFDKYLDPNFFQHRVSSYSNFASWKNNEYKT